MSRGLSTVADALVFLLLVSLAATTLAVAPGPAAAPSAEEPATVVARTTASVNYSLAPGARGAPETFPRVGDTFDRYAHGRLAGLLARAATRNTSVDGRELTATSDDLERAVAAATVNATGPRTQVVAVWTPYEGSGVVGRATAGASPPRDASVASQVIAVETRGVGARERALRAANRTGYAGVATVLAEATVATLLPPEGMANALAADYPTDRLAARRYDRAGTLFGANVSAATTDRNATVADTRIEAALVQRFERELRTRFGSPTEAARAVRAGEVRIVVRRWSQ